MESLFLSLKKSLFSDFFLFWFRQIQAQKVLGWKSMKFDAFNFACTIHGEPGLLLEGKPSCLQRPIVKLELPTHGEVGRFKVSKGVLVQ